jgi:hypothetical protein
MAKTSAQLRRSMEVSRVPLGPALPPTYVSGTRDEGRRFRMRQEKTKKNGSTAQRPDVKHRS